jgi:hypothetical protein
MKKKVMKLIRHIKRNKLKKYINSNKIQTTWLNYQIEKYGYKQYKIMLLKCTGKHY